MSDTDRDSIPVTDEPALGGAEVVQEAPPEDPSAAASAWGTTMNATAEAASDPRNDSSKQMPLPTPYVDETGADPTKNDEVPSPRDGRTRENMTYGDGVCPLLGSGTGVKKVAEIGGYEVTVHQPYRALTEPVECPTCKKMVESHQLTWDVANGGASRDCPTAINLRSHPVSKEVQAALDNGEETKAGRIADRHPVREQFLRLLGFRKPVSKEQA